MPAWVKDKALWDKAKKAVLPNADNYDEPYAVVAHIYKNMGGAVEGSQDQVPQIGQKDQEQVKRDLPDLTKEATPGSAVAQLMRAKNNEAFQPGTLVDQGKREVEVIIITEGPGNVVDKHYYTKQAIEDGVEKFNGARSFLNHQTEDEEGARPEQDIQVLCGFFKETKLVQVKDRKQGKMVSGIAAVFVAEESEAGDKALAAAKTQLVWAQLFPESPDCYAGISVNTGGWADGTMEIDGEEWKKVVGFENVRSADIVTRPARGGAFLRLAESMDPVGSNHPKENADMKNAAKIKQTLDKLTESDKKLAAETDSAKKAALAKESENLKQTMRLLLEAEEEADDTKKPPKDSDADADEAEDESEDDKGDGDDHMGDLKKHMPMKDGEEEEAYKTRVKNAMHAAGKALKGGEAEDEGEAEGEDEGEKKQAKKESAKESRLVKAFRESQPVLFKQIVTQVRESVSSQRLDFASLKEANATLTQENRILKTQALLGKIKAELSEAGIPEHIMKPSDLIDKDAESRKREINRLTLVMESGSAHVWTGKGGNAGSDMAGDALESYGLPTNSK